MLSVRKAGVPVRPSSRGVWLALFGIHSTVFIKNASRGTSLVAQRPSQCRGRRFDPDRVTRIPHAVRQLSPRHNYCVLVCYTQDLTRSNINIKKRTPHGPGCSLTLRVATSETPHQGMLRPSWPFCRSLQSAAANTCPRPTFL